MVSYKLKVAEPQLEVDKNRATLQEQTIFLYVKMSVNKVKYFKKYKFTKKNKSYHSSE